MAPGTLLELELYRHLASGTLLELLGLDLDPSVAPGALLELDLDRRRSKLN